MKKKSTELTGKDFRSLHDIYRQIRGEEDLVIYAFGGREGNRETYLSKISFSDLTRHFSLVPSGVTLPNNLMLQRDLIMSRSTSIKQYLINNEDFVFPEVISVCESFILDEIESIPNLFRLSLRADSFRYLVDGQGRLSGITRALEEMPSLADSTIDIKFVLSSGVENDTQLFSDINMTPVAPNKSQCAAMDSRKSVNRFAKRVVVSLPELTDLVDYTKASVTNSSSAKKLWTLNQVVAFVLMVTGTTSKTCEKELNTDEKQEYWTGFIRKYFECLKKNPKFRDAVTGAISASDVRESSIVGTSVFLKSLALTGKVLMMHFINKGDAQADWSIMDRWSEIDLSKSNKEWLGRCMNYRGGYEDKSFNHKAMASYFLSEMGISMPEQLEDVEEEVLLCRASMMKAKREAEKAVRQESLQLVDKEAV